MSKYLKSLLMMAVAFSVVETSTAAAQDKLETAPNKTVEANGIKFSYRSFGKTTGTPLILLQLHGHHGLLGPSSCEWFS